MNTKCVSGLWNSATKYTSDYWIETILLFMYFKLVFAAGLYTF